MPSERKQPHKRTDGEGRRDPLWADLPLIEEATDTSSDTPADATADGPSASARSAPRRSRSRRRVGTYRVAICSVFCALCVVILGLGALIELIDMTAAALAALVLLPILLRYGSGYTLLCWGVTSLLGILLMPQSLAPWLFLCLLGYYPVLKRQIDRLPRLPGYLCKLVLVCLALGLYLCLFRLVMMNGEGSLTDVFLTGFGEGDAGVGPAMAWALVGLCILTFFVFDLLIDKLYIVYRLKWRKRAEKWMK